MLGGVAMGTYPVFVKTPRVLSSKPEPVVFQGYKSAWVAITGVFLLLVRWLSGAEPTYVFTPWAAASAAAWVVAGSCLIAAVPAAGVGPAVLVFDGSTTILSFAVFTLAFHEPIKAYPMPFGGGEYYRAPFYLCGALLGMAGIVFIPEYFGSESPAKAAAMAANAATSSSSLESCSSHDSKTEPLLEHVLLSASGGSMPWRGRLALSYALALAAGVFSAIQYAIVTLAKKYAMTPSTTEAFDALGSWTATFGVSAVAVNGLLIGAMCWRSARSRQKLPNAHLRDILLPGSLAGIFYCAALLLTTLAVQLGGNAVTLAQRNATSLVTSGLWGLLYYQEVQGTRAIVAWCVAAFVTMVCVILLGLEKAA